MPNSLKCMIKKLRHKGKLNDAEYGLLTTKLIGHDKTLRNNVLEEAIGNMHDASKCEYMAVCDVVNVLENMKEGA